ncbi:hypothetical protein JOF56_004267 [Kibdelosporangium banguiense]|uniref:DUF8017 domain-containing protein n=1 Tax=Kibdelosporangium banguiense TaxID=1365924 RepID=A0ABS4THH1_9PSEU|nr:hypothetical protein [Kibdelosporangium banguiense]MBP2323882.1 hypothetical protein [Kibdelosporangium banguiense]
MTAPGGGYQGLGYYAEPPEEKKKATGLLLAVVVAAVVVVGLVVTLIVVGPSQPTSGVPLAAQGSVSSSARPGGNPLQPKATGAPKVAGWKVIPINDGKNLQTSKAYDVPSNWEPLTTSAAFGPDGNRFTLFTPAIFQKGYCPGAPTSFRAMAGVTTVTNSGDNAAQSIAGAQKILDAVFHTKNNTKPQVTMGQPTPVSIDRDKRGYTVTAKADITPGPEDKCTPAKATVSVVVLETKPEEKTSVVIAAFADQDFAQAVPETDLQKIVTSMHAAN